MGYENKLINPPVSLKKELAYFINEQKITKIYIDIHKEKPFVHLSQIEEENVTIEYKSKQFIINKKRQNILSVPFSLIDNWKLFNTIMNTFKLRFQLEGLQYRIFAELEN